MYVRLELKHATYIHTECVIRNEARQTYASYASQEMKYTGYTWAV